MSQFERTERLIGAERQRTLRRAGVAIFGLGGVGGYVLEALARAGIGRLLLVDGDLIDKSNLSRQLLATHDAIGLPKSDVAKARALSINPGADVDARPVFYGPATRGQFDLAQYDYVVDAIDSVGGKLLLAEDAARAGVPIISSMGAGNKLDPARFELADIFETSVCPLARAMRRELKARGIDHLTVVYSKETPRTAPDDTRTPGSISFVPGAAGLVIAGKVVRDLCGL